MVPPHPALRGHLPPKGEGLGIYKFPLFHIDISVYPYYNTDKPTEIIGYLVNSKEVQSIWPMYSAVCCVRISAVAECLTPGWKTSGRVGLLCIACKISRRTVFSAREL